MIIKCRVIQTKRRGTPNRFQIVNTANEELMHSKYVYSGESMELKIQNISTNNFPILY